MEVDKWDTKKVSKVIRIAWNILFIYLIAVMVYVWFDAQKHPENYALVSERPLKDNTMNNNNILLGKQAQFIPEWQYQASTMQECKPLVHIMQIYEVAIKPFFWVLFIVIIIQGINTFAAEQNKKEEKDKQDETK